MRVVWPSTKVSRRLRFQTGYLMSSFAALWML